MVLLSPLALLRLLLVAPTLLLFAALCAVSTLRAPPDEPLAPWRRRIVLGSRHLGRVVVWLLGFWVNITGWQNYSDAQKQGTVRLRPTASLAPCGAQRKC